MCLIFCPTRTYEFLFWDVNFIITLIHPGLDTEGNLLDLSYRTLDKYLSMVGVLSYDLTT